MQYKHLFFDVAKQKKKFSAVLYIAKKMADKNTSISPNHSFLEVFGLVSNSPNHTSLLCVKIPAPNFSLLGIWQRLLVVYMTLWSYTSSLSTFSCTLQCMFAYP